MFEYELEAMPELEGEAECEAFFGGLARLAGRAIRSPALRRVGAAAARSALGGLLREEEGEEEFEGEYEMNPLRRVYPDALMEHLGHAATEAESEAEAEAFVGALVPLAARLIPRVAPAVMRAAPRLIRGAARITRTLRRNPATRPLVRTLPTIMRRTVAGMARQAARGAPVTPRAAVRTLARQTARVIGSPRQCVRAYRRSAALDRRYHGAPPPAARPMAGARPVAARRAPRPMARAM